ncbi:hypothetical protein IE077_001345 [Cardiosporidium cionae]|uniref:Uncharacterized protein n=1 Tax=Cardiosporidium cionae TaxID=476202 RepID=A0ABQ7JD39_9APIC|nr:hypothetical protein IE077_001345 [Cardiosporidium cionae]|eukprot:KAF8821932.1 hypothetical protein IE077_001345 [Cardiosporidium cionae]
MVSAKFFATVCLLLVCCNNYAVHGIAQEEQGLDLEQLSQSLQNESQFESILPAAKEFMESLERPQESSELLADILKRMSPGSPDALSSPLRTFEQIESQFLAFLSAQFPGAFSQLSNQPCALMGVNPRCFVIGYAGAIGQTWGTRSADEQKMTQLVDTFLQPVGLTRPFAKLVCISAPKTFPVLTFQNRVETHAETAAIVKSVIANCTKSA